MPIDVFDDWILEIEGATATVRLTRPNYFLTQGWRLLGTGSKRGSDVLMPGATGVRPRRRRPTVTERSLPLMVTGLLDAEGAATADPDAALDSVLTMLDDELVTDPATMDGTRVARLIRPGSTRETALHVLELEPTREIGPYTLECALVLSIPQRFVVAGGS